MGQIECIEGAKRSGPQSNDAVNHIVSASSRRCEMKQIINGATIKRFAYVQLMEFKARVQREMSDVIDTTGKQIIDRDHFISLCQQGVAKMRSQETCSTCYKNTHISLDFVSKRQERR